MRLETLVNCVAIAAVSLLVLPKGYTQDTLAPSPSRASLTQSSEATGIHFRNIGPDIFSGRVVDLAINPDTPTHFLVAFATGGLWETRNNGRSFRPLFEGVTAASLGDIAVDWQNRRLWVGTGENNASRSSYAGDGLYVSDDWGQNWRSAGLTDARHVGRICLDPRDPQTATVAVMGGLYSAEGTRGLYRTSDGGRTWRAVLATTGFVGAIDIVRDPLDAEILYAATWERARSAWDFREGGNGSAVYRSVDGGVTWSKYGSGFPSGPDVGRIGLSVADSAGVSYLYAVLDNQARRPTDPQQAKLTLATLDDMAGDVFAQADSTELAILLSDNGFPFDRYPFDSLRREAGAGRLTPKLVRDYLRDANADLFDTPVVGAEVYRLDRERDTWSRTHEGYLDDVFYSYGYYFAQVRAHPKRPSRLYVMGVPALRSDDGGRTWRKLGGGNVHSDHHAMSLLPADADYVLLGNDGGVNVSYDAGETFYRTSSPPAGQFYAVAVDDAKPYRVYGGTQDNGVWRGPSDFSPGDGWELYGDQAYEHIYGGDGMQVAVDPTDGTVYTGYQFGNYARISADGESESVKPTHALGERPLRFNWQTPIHLSVHQPQTFYIGSNKFHRSLDRGEHYDLTSEDLTLGGQPGDVPFGTLTTIHESPIRYGLLYVGTDDGLVHVSADGGYDWELRTTGLAAGKWVSRVQASAHNLDRVFVAQSGYRDDDPSPYLSRSDDRGRTYVSIAAGLPEEPINDILEDSVNPDLLYVATDGGVYYSLDAGKAWHVLGDLPLVPVHDLVIQEREHELVVGTHGRSLFVGDISRLRHLRDSVGDAGLFVFTPEPITRNKRWGKSWSTWSPADTVTVDLDVYTKTSGELEVTLSDSVGHRVVNWRSPVVRGLNTVKVPLLTNDRDQQKSPGSAEEAYIPEGTYGVTIKHLDTDEAFGVKLSLTTPRNK